MIKSLLFLFILFSSHCTSIEKERLELDKAKFEFEKKKLEFEKERLKTCGCNGCSTCNKCGAEEISLEKKTNPDCVKENPPSSEEIWALSVEGNWHYSPDKIKTNNICKGDLKESFYKQFANTESYVAETQVPTTKKSSCINNVLFSGKSLLYNLMLDKTATEESITLSKSDKSQILKETIEYNTAEKGRSFYYECKPTDSAGKWDSCKCVLYTSYSQGKQGLSSRMKK
ncbi:MAG: hypothetical protein IPL26_01000 [Leptospiraceae bacterium]|nr:hypothetical protein [Leptospiraceae bacterium]